MKEASGLDVSFGDLEGMWLVGKQLRSVGDRSVKAKVSQLLVLAMPIQFNKIKSILV
ncbi:hypothetical protein QJS10_CPB14g00836 [Acorus calamus]|uniref:Uncharacterized protein n=1 Tax=Acorus calamus TaxID=4465 RepID=A0AAV9DEB7_ACOCL|nr:hypothetical protein QJS10_CPB14g00836 [Acorus calamus]